MESKQPVINDNAVFSAANLRKYFPVRRRLRDIARGTARNYVRAVDGVSFEIRHNEIFGLIGESGSGKTTTGKMVMNLLPPTSGDMRLDGNAAVGLKKEALAKYRRDVQMIFQDPYASMNPRFNLKTVMEEPLLIHKIGSGYDQRLEIISKALEEVKLIPADDFLTRFPHMLSGGQRQRAATARTLILNPKLLVADEPVSMIDLSTRAEVLHMLRQVQQRMKLSILYITHDLSTARYFTDRIAVMYLGRIIEVGDADEIIDRPCHPYTRALIEAVCEPVPGKARIVKKLPIHGEIPSPANVPPGCRFHSRCVYNEEECKQMPEPELEPVAPDHYTACRLWKKLTDYLHK